ncbi:McrB family protein [Candidatus Spongiihabitans sp.]|uniref:McrB family protein n=1 Tax=Candidatus Spongiihabitans sp. TaxID=3101308 RepID=UPI003C6F8293
MRIKFRGTVKENPADGRPLKVDWEQNYKTRDWYVNTKRRTIHKLDKPDDLPLINFVFHGHEQDYDKFLFGEETMPSMHPLNQILYGPPGTGKTWNTVNHALAIIEGQPVEDLERESRTSEGRKAVKLRFDKLKECGQIEMVTFHQNFAYEDFIEGIRPVLGGDSDNVRYEIVNGVFKRIADQATDEGANYVLIIDEINRGNIAKIFGELITLIEDAKRIGNKDTMTVTLPYSSNSDDEDDSFGVPNNLYIIGTMNTADRSIALLDTALRRRFDFIEMMPQPDHVLINDNVDGVNCRELLKVMNKRITALLNREHQIGHSYFIGVDDMEKLANVFQHKIIPLLQEYFYDDWAKIDLVLNKNRFVTSDKVETDLFSSTELMDIERLIYELIDANSNKWKDPAKYKKIYATTQTKSDDGDGE